MSLFFIGRSGRPARQRSQVVKAAGAVVEMLEGRQLLTASVPADYVFVGSVNVTALSSAGANTPSLQAGRNYYFVADGQHQLAKNPIRKADAAGYESSPGNWVAGTHLHVANVTWGSAHAADGEYGAAYTATADGPVHAFVSDSNYADNAGSLTLSVYEQVTLDSLTVTSQQWSDETATAADNSTQVVGVSMKDDPGGSSSAGLVQTLSITGVVTPDSSEAFSHVLYTVTADATGNQVAGGSLTQAGVTFDMNEVANGYDYTIRAGVDRNGDGLLSPLEVTRTLAAEGEHVTARVKNPTPAEWDDDTSTLTLKRNGPAVKLTFQAYSGKNKVKADRLSVGASTVSTPGFEVNADGDMVVTFTPKQLGQEDVNILDTVPGSGNPQGIGKIRVKVVD